MLVLHSGALGDFVVSLPVVMGLRLFQEWRRGKGRQKQRGR